MECSRPACRDRRAQRPARPDQRDAPAHPRRRGVAARLHCLPPARRAPGAGPIGGADPRPSRARRSGDARASTARSSSATTPSTAAGTGATSTCAAEPPTSNGGGARACVGDRSRADRSVRPHARGIGRALPARADRRRQHRPGAVRGARRDAQAPSQRPRQLLPRPAVPHLVRARRRSARPARPSRPSGTCTMPAWWQTWPTGSATGSTGRGCRRRSSGRRACFRPCSPCRATCWARSSTRTCTASSCGESSRRRCWWTRAAAAPSPTSATAATCYRPCRRASCPTSRCSWRPRSAAAAPAIPPPMCTPPGRSSTTR